jgi:hypothetical protein
VSAHSSIPRYPLEWPIGWKRTDPRQRQRAEFRRTVNDVVDGQVKKRGVAVSVIVATGRLERQLELLGVKGDMTLSTNVSLRLDGRPRSDEEPRDPGAAIYFSFKGKATVLACDKWTRVADNIAAIAAHIDALRRVDRYGVGTIEQALAGYKALPADTAADWRAAFGFTAGARVTVDELTARYRMMAKDRHPADKTGDDGAAMAWLNRARDYALAELEG